MIKAGFCEVDITPSIGMSGGGEYNYGIVNKIATPFSISASIWQDDKHKIAIVGADVIDATGSLIDKIAKKMQKEIGLDYLVFASSHTHKSGPCAEWIMHPEEVDNITDLEVKTRKGIKKQLGFFDPQYRELIENRLVDAIISADQKAEEVRLISGSNIVEDVAYNRRLIMKDGTVATHAGLGHKKRGELNLDILDFAGPVDKEAVVLGAINSKDEIIGAIVNFACHATVENQNCFSADWPYFMRETIKRNINPNMVPVFINGCCGDVTQLNNLSPEPLRNSGKWPKILGQRVGFAAIDILTRETPSTEDEISFVQDDLMVAYRPTKDEDYHKAIDELNKYFHMPIEKRSKFAPFYMRELVLLRHVMKSQPKLRFPLGAVNIGKLLIIALPTETFAATGLKLKKQSPTERTMIATMANDHLGYLPTKEIFAQATSGGWTYENISGGNRLKPGTCEKVEAKCLELVKQLYPQKLHG